VKNLFFRFWWIVPVIAMVASITAAGLIVKSASSQTTTQNNQVVECKADKEADYKCWKKYFETIVYNDNPQAALVSAQQENNKQGYVRNNCHQLAHIIGRASAKKYNLDVAKTFEQGNQFCASGYYHGAMESITAVNGVQKIKDTMNDICKPFKQQSAYNLKHYDCVHGLGHGVMSMENYELFKALEDCELLSDVWERDSCASGVFMENIMSVFNNPEYPSKYLKKEEPLYPCTAVDEIHKSSCYLNQSSYALSVTNYDYAKVFGLCGQAGISAYICYQSVGRDASGNSIQDANKANDICQLGASYDEKLNCVIGAVKDIIWIGNSKAKGDEFCNLQQDANIKSDCLSTAESYYKTFQ
jgi:hypothetical protein